MFLTWAPAGELYGQRDAGRFYGFCKEKTLYEATGLSRRRNRPTSHPPIKIAGLEIELTKHTVFD